MINKITSKNHTEAIRDYMEAYNKYVDMLDKYFPVSEVIQGRKIKLDKALTIEVVEELDRLAKDVEEKRKIWMYFLRVKK